jgi:serine/threonine protein kinase
MTEAPTWPEIIHNYHIGPEIGHGAFAHVFKCTKIGDEAEYAIKIFSKSHLACPGDTERFQREINTMAFLKHDNLIALHDLFWDHENFYLVMDFCPGGELFSYIVQNTKLEEPTAATVFRQIMAGIAYLHSFSVAHRDLKPENILITKFPQVRVADFGLCGFIAEDKLMKTFCGSPVYCSPECLSKQEYDGRKSDVWSLGVILYAMVTGTLPWNVSNTASMLRAILKASFTIPGHVSAGCKELLHSMMRPAPADRISVEKILEHPWLKIGKILGTRKVLSGRPATLPPLRGLTIEDIAQMTTLRASERDQTGIVSPFDGDVPVVDVEQELEIMGLRPTTGKKPPNPLAATTGGARPKLPILSMGMALAQNRQRSAKNMLVKPIGPVHKPLEVIRE